MKKRPRGPAVVPDEADLFRASMADVTPLRHSRTALKGPRPHPIPVQKMRDEREVLRESLRDETAWEIGLNTGEELTFSRPGIDARTLRRLRRGEWVIQDEIDLHGCNSAEARELLTDFLASCSRRSFRCVRIVHGKGLRSRNREPVLKRKVAAWLMMRDDVLAYCQAPRADGGSGAVVVLLKGVTRER